MRSRQTLLLLLGVALTIAVFASRAPAQAVYGNIIGTVTDPQGAAIVGATVTISDPAKNISRTTQTNESGNYTVTNLVPGRYQVRVEQRGYKVAAQEVEVKADVTARVDFSLQVGEVTEQVTVTEETQEISLKTDRADVATSFSQRQLQELPIFDRNFTNFTLLTPGTQKLGWQHAASENPQGSIQIMVNGQHFSGTAFQLDGTDNRDPILGIIVINPTLESATEAKITTQNYDAEFGLATAGVVTAQTRSGSNEPHGSAFIFRRNDLFQARDPFSQSVPDAVTGRLLPESLWSQFGGSFGWRLKKDKNFIFGDYQGTRSKEGASVLTTVPTARARTGDLSEYGRTIYDPLTGDPNTAVGRTPFPGNIIPANRLSPQALNLLKLIPLPNRPGISNNYSASGQDVFNGDQFNVRDDHYWSQNLHIFGRYSFAQYDRTKPGAFGFLVGGPGLSGARFAGTSNVRNQSIAAGFDYTVSPNTITDFRFGYFRYRVKVLPGGVGTRPAAEAGIPGLNVDDFFTSGMPFFAIEGPGGFQIGYALEPNGCNCPLDQDEQQYQFVNNWTFLRGNHAYKFGGDIRYAINLRVPSDAHRSGQLRFNEARTGVRLNPSDPNITGGLGIATFLLGDVTNFVRYVSTRTDAKEYQRRWFFYGQDTWRRTRKLTINYGLRWELIFPEKVKRPGDGGLLNLDTGEIFVANVGQVGPDFNVKPTYKAFAPRLGIAYQWTDRTVIRMGYGRSFDIGVFGSIFGHTVTQNLPVLAFQSLSTDNFKRVFTLASGPPAPTFPSVPSNGRLPLPVGIEGRARPFKMRLPTLDAWNVTVQHQFTPNTSVEIAYVGNKGTHVFLGDGPAYNVNQPVNNPDIIDEALRRPFFRRFGWTQNITYYGNDADNRYNALQTKFETRFSGLSLLAHYTLSAARNYGDGYYHDRKVEYGPTSFDRKHVFLFSQVWDLPFGRGRRYLNNISRGLDFLVGGWQINSITVWQSGLPFTAFVSGANCSVNSGPCRPDRVGNPNVNNPSRNGWFAVGIGPGTPWAKAPRGQFGNVGRNTLRGPAFFNTDLSIFKNFSLTESTRLEFRAEVFNLFNKVNLGQPDSCVDCNPSTAGKIFGLASGARMRNAQFGLRLKF